MEMQMPKIEIQKVLYVDGKHVHISSHVEITSGAQLTAGEMKALQDKFSWSMDSDLNVVDESGEIVLHTHGMTY
jgi:hypothetical protein